MFDQLKHSFHTPNNADVVLSTFVFTCHKILVLARVLTHALESLMKTRLSLQILSNFSEQTYLSVVEKNYPSFFQTRGAPFKAKYGPTDSLFRYLPLERVCLNESSPGPVEQAFFD